MAKRKAVDPVKNEIIKTEQEGDGGKQVVSLSGGMKLSKWAKENLRILTVNDLEQEVNIINNEKEKLRHDLQDEKEYSKQFKGKKLDEQKKERYRTIFESAKKIQSEGGRIKWKTIIYTKRRLWFETDEEFEKFYTAFNNWQNRNNIWSLKDFDNYLSTLRM